MNIPVARFIAAVLLLGAPIALPAADPIQDGIVTLTIRNARKSAVHFDQAHVTCSYRSNALARKVW